MIERSPPSHTPPTKHPPTHTDYDDAATLAALHSSEVCRKSLMLPAASSAVRVEHVGRVLAVSDNRSSAASGAGAGASAQLSSGGGGSGTGVLFFMQDNGLREGESFWEGWMLCRDKLTAPHVQCTARTCASDVLPVQMLTCMYVLHCLLCLLPCLPLHQTQRAVWCGLCHSTPCRPPASPPHLRPLLALSSLPLCCSAPPSSFLVDCW